MGGKPKGHYSIAVIEFGRFQVLFRSTMPAEFEGLGIRFLYPDTWLLDPESDSNAVSIESPEGAFMTITQVAGLADSAAALEGASAAMQAEYDEVEREQVSQQFGDLTLDGCILRFVYLDLIITSQLLVFTHQHQTYLVQIQAEDRDHERLRPVFEAMLTSIGQSFP